MFESVGLSLSVTSAALPKFDVIPHIGADSLLASSRREQRSHCPGQILQHGFVRQCDGKPRPALLIALQTFIETSLELACHLRRAVRRRSLRDHLASNA